MLAHIENCLKKTLSFVSQVNQKQQDLDVDFIMFVRYCNAVP